jgi:rhodanese-related sulfurtransferase
MYDTTGCHETLWNRPSTPHDGAGRICLIGLCACAVLLFQGLARAADDPPDDEPPAVVTPAAEPSAPPAKPPSKQSYCGVQSLYRALRFLGKDLEFADLVKPEYISSKQGSTVTDLQNAARDFGGVAQPMSRMTCAILRQVHTPVILHVKPNLKATEYRHWVLFMGTRGGKAWIYDGDQPGAEMGFDELAARWDGAALLVSDSPMSRAAIWLAALCPFLLYGGLAAFGIGLIYMLEQRWGGAQRTNPWPGTLRACIGQAAALLVIILGVAAAYRVTSGQGFLSSRAAIAEIQDSHFENFLPKVKTADMAKLLHTPGVTVVDARQAKDYRAGHLDGAISIPVNSSPRDCQQALADVSTDERIVVYSHSSGCAYGEKVARKLIDLGYQNISMFKGGWVEWEKAHPQISGSAQLVKGQP